MSTVTILRTLWRLRLINLLVVVVAVIVGVLVAYRVSLPSLKLESRKYEVGVATARILVDTPASQVVDVAPKGSNTLGVRANLLANLMVDGAVKTIIATKAGLLPEHLSGMGDSLAAAPSVRKDNPRGYQLTTHVVNTPDGNWLPIIEIETQGPHAADAARVADAAVAGLRQYLDSKAAHEKVADASRLRVSGLGTAQARTVVRGPRLLFAAAAALLIVLAGFATTIGLSALIQAFRDSSMPDPAGAAADPADVAHDGLSVEGSDHTAEIWPPRPATVPQVVPDDADVRERAS